MGDGLPFAKGRGSQIHPPNRFDSVHAEPEQQDVAWDAGEDESAPRRVPTQFFPDESKSVVTKNDSPDVAFRYSLNPYRGCEHGCAYCYARPSHEYLGLNAGLDFETKLFVKERAPELFRKWLSRKKWVPEVIVFSGITDCYQPAERIYRLTRQCLEVALEFRQPVAIITKNALVIRDLDVLKQMAEFNIINVSLSITSLDESLARRMEPRTSPPAARLRAIRELSQAGVPARAMVAPIIPGLNDVEVAEILRAVAEAGACSAHYVLLRLPLAVRPVFEEWLSRTMPTHRERVESRIRSTRAGQMNDAQFGRRMRGTGILAEQIAKNFKLFARRYGLDGKGAALETAHFRRPAKEDRQRRLF